MTEGITRLGYPVRIDSWQPHGHLRLVGAKLEVLDPTTGRKTLISMVSNWNAGWHHSHVYEDDYAPLIPAGSHPDPDSVVRQHRGQLLAAAPRWRSGHVGGDRATARRTRCRTSGSP
jgi:hypothetical protein